MDLLTFELEIFYGLSLGAFGFAAGLGFKNLAIPRIKQHIFDLANAYVAGFIQNLKEHPELVDSLIGPFIESIMKQLQQPAGPGSSPGARRGGFKIAGFTIPNEILQPIIERVLGGFVKKTANPALGYLPGSGLPEG